MPGFFTEDDPLALPVAVDELPFDRSTAVSPLRVDVDVLRLQPTAPASPMTSTIASMVWATERVVQAKVGSL